MPPIPDPSPFQLDEVNAALTGTDFHNRLHHLVTTPSTNDLALAAAHSGALKGVWIADEQTAGRGRGAHTWHSARGDGLYLTALVSPHLPMQSALRLSFTTAIAVQSAIASTCGFRIRDQIDIRWPNDLLLHDRKCGGILIETAAASGSSAMLRYAVIGIGLNVNHTGFPPDLDPIATSLRRELPHQPAAPLRREPLAAAILLALDRELCLLAAPNGERTTENGQRNLESFSSWLRNKRVFVEPRPGDSNPTGYTGTTAGLDPQGFLRVLGDDGKLHTVLTGGLREPST